jgi:hypothetical protein
VAYCGGGAGQAVPNHTKLRFEKRHNSFRRELRSPGRAAPFCFALSGLHGHFLKIPGACAPGYYLPPLRG